MLTNESIIELATQYSSAIVFLALASVYLVSILHKHKKPESNKAMTLNCLHAIVCRVNKFKCQGTANSKYSGDKILCMLTDVWSNYMTDDIVHKDDLDEFIAYRNSIRNMIANWDVTQDVCEKMVLITDTIELIRSSSVSRSNLSVGTSTIL